MTLGLIGKKNALESAPEIPYRKHTDEEREEFWRYVREFGPKFEGGFWQQTEEQAREVLKTIAEEGFIVGGELGWGNSIDGSGVHSHIYSKNYTGKDVGRSCDYDSVVGDVSLWEEGGFLSNPVSLWYQNPEVINDTFELRDYLISSDIPFHDSVDLDRIRRQISDLEKRKSGNLEILSRLKDVDLRK